MTVNVGSDRITFLGERVVIDAKHEITGWSIREFCRPPIYFQGRKYFLSRRRVAQRPFAACYELAPWPEDLREESPQSFVYDADFVARRDENAREERKRSLAWQLLLPLYPLLGLCWSGFKERVLSPIGFLPKSITAASTMLMFGFALLDGIMVGYLGSGIVSLFGGNRLFHGFTRLIDFLLLAVLFLDCAFRYSQLLDDDVDVPAGFLEWAFRSEKRDRL